MILLIIIKDLSLNLERIWCVEMKNIYTCIKTLLLVCKYEKSDNGNLNESYCTRRIYIILEKPNPLWLSLFTNYWNSKWNRLVSLTEQAFVENHSNRIQSESLWNMKFYVCIILITEYIFFEFLSFKLLLHWDKTDIKDLWYFRFQQICSSKSFCFVWMTDSRSV